MAQAAGPELHPDFSSLLVARVPNSPLDRAIYNALAVKDLPGRWKEVEVKNAKACTLRNAEVRYLPDSVVEITKALGPSAEPLTRVDQSFQAMKGDLVADIIDILYWHWLENGRLNPTQISLSQILKYRKVKPGSVLEKTHWAALLDTFALHLVTKTGCDPVFVFHRAYSTSLRGKPGPPTQEECVSYTPGAHITAAIGNRHTYLAPYSSILLKLDPYRQSFAKRFARYLRAEWRLNPEGYIPTREARYRCWGDHLTGAGIELKTTFHGRPSTAITTVETMVQGPTPGRILLCQSSQLLWRRLDTSFDVCRRAKPDALTHEAVAGSCPGGPEGVRGWMYERGVSLQGRVPRSLSNPVTHRAAWTGTRGAAHTHLAPRVVHAAASSSSGEPNERASLLTGPFVKRFL